MRILVTVKFTPDLQSNRSFTDGAVTRTAEDGSMNELDENAVEAALQLVEAAGEGEVYALTVGGPDAVAAVRKALQLGVHHAIHVSDAGVSGSDVFGTARVLAAGFLLWSLATALTGFAGGLAALVVLRLAMGAGEATFYPSALSLLSRLTFREREVALRVRDGLTTEEIAKELRRSKLTIKTQLAGIFRKLGVANRSRVTAMLNR